MNPFNCACELIAINRTNAFNYISAFYFLASVFGSAIGSLLLSNHVYLLNGLSIGCYLFTAYIAISVSAHYGREDSTEDDGQSFVESGYEDLSPTPPSMRSFRPSLLSPKVLYP